MDEKSDHKENLREDGRRPVKGHLDFWLRQMDGWDFYLKLGEMKGRKLFFFFLLLKVSPEAYGVESEPQLSATARATRDPSRTCNLHHSSWQHQIPDSLSRVRYRTRILMDTGQIRFCRATKGTPEVATV